MRRVSKPWPPANVSPDGQATCTMAKAEQDYLAALPAAQDKTAFARSEFDQLDKAKLRQVMYREQRSICIYCERTIQEGPPAPRVDHWKPLCANHGQALCWRNLYLSCPTPGTCDDAKGQRPLKWDAADPDLPWPIDFAYEDVLGFTSRGEIYVRSDANPDDTRRKALELSIDHRQDGDRKRAAILNLNHPTLVAARAAALDSERTKLQKEFEETTVSCDERTQRANALAGSDPLPQFVSIRIAWLKKMIGKGR